MSNQDKLNAVTHIRYEPFSGGSPIIMTFDEANDTFGCLVEALQGYSPEGAVFAMDEGGNDIYIAWD